MSPLRNPILIPRILAVKIIELYQKTLSPDHGALKNLHSYGYCRHHPTCSEYGKRQIQEKGVIVGGVLTTKRVLGCNPCRKLSDEKIETMVK
ncbi:MAG: membrane protein insertion efficiency factor YidD [Candidatus Peribacteraceae bacterium]|jgi:hypothetical protein|nr:membrane protein insertion efficiency factor YidD [Candidatus Peribacteraceae bacterium]|tara:strand:+ start:274 stop:549 length:276 start_codon:yes stop_codon:yes gene_type:complete